MLTNSLSFNWSGSNPYREICKNLVSTSCKRFFPYSVLVVEQHGGFPEQKVVIFVLRKKKPAVCQLPVPAAPPGCPDLAGSFPCLAAHYRVSGRCMASKCPCLPRDARRPQQVPAAPPAPWQRPAGREASGAREEPQGGHPFPSGSGPVFKPCLCSWAHAAKTRVPFLPRAVWKQQQPVKYTGALPLKNKELSHQLPGRGKGAFVMP